MTVIVKVCIEDARGSVTQKREVEITPDSKPDAIYAKLLQPFAILADKTASVYVKNRFDEPKKEIILDVPHTPDTHELEDVFRVES